MNSKRREYFWDDIASGFQQVGNRTLTVADNVFGNHEMNDVGATKCIHEYRKYFSDGKLKHDTAYLWTDSNCTGDKTPNPDQVQDLRNSTWDGQNDATSSMIVPPEYLTLNVYEHPKYEGWGTTYYQPIVHNFAATGFAHDVLSSYSAHTPSGINMNDVKTVCCSDVPLTFASSTGQDQAFWKKQNEKYQIFGENRCQHYYKGSDEGKTNCPKFTESYCGSEDRFIRGNTNCLELYKEYPQKADEILRRYPKTRDLCCFIANMDKPRTPPRKREGYVHGGSESEPLPKIKKWVNGEFPTYSPWSKGTKKQTGLPGAIDYRVWYEGGETPKYTAYALVKTTYDGKPVYRYTLYLDPIHEWQSSPGSITIIKSVGGAPTSGISEGTYRDKVPGSAILQFMQEKYDLSDADIRYLLRSWSDYKKICRSYKVGSGDAYCSSCEDPFTAYCTSAGGKVDTANCGLDPKDLKDDQDTRAVNCYPKNQEHPIITKIRKAAGPASTSVNKNCFELCNGTSGGVSPNFKNPRGRCSEHTGKCPDMNICNIKQLSAYVENSNVEQIANCIFGGEKVEPTKPETKPDPETKSKPETKTKPDGVYRDKIPNVRPLAKSEYTHGGTESDRLEHARKWAHHEFASYTPWTNVDVIDRKLSAYGIVKEGSAYRYVVYASSADLSEWKASSGAVIVKKPWTYQGDQESPKPDVTKPKPKPEPKPKPKPKLPIITPVIEKDEITPINDVPDDDGDDGGNDDDGGGGITVGDLTSDKPTSELHQKMFDTKPVAEKGTDPSLTSTNAKADDDDSIISKTSNDDTSKSSSTWNTLRAHWAFWPVAIGIPTILVILILALVFV